MNKEYNFSIIIPTFSNPLLLRRLLDSIPKREDLQIIVVDDCSPDSVWAEYRTFINDYGIELYKTPHNIGGGGARNIGIEMSLGKYVIFADSDDFFLPSFSSILDYVLKNEHDITFFNFISLFDNNYKISKRGSDINEIFNEFKKDQHLSLNKLKYLFGEPWCKVIKRSLIIDNKIRFQEVKVHNDTFFSYMVGYYSKSSIVYDVCGYVVIDRPTSVSRTDNLEKWLLRTQIFANKNLFFKKNNINIFDEMLLSPFWHYAIKRNVKNFYKCLAVSKLYGYGFKEIIPSLIKSKIKHFVKRLS